MSSEVELIEPGDTDGVMAALVGRGVELDTMFGRPDGQTVVKLPDGGWIELDVDVDGGIDYCVYASEDDVQRQDYAPVARALDEVAAIVARESACRHCGSALVPGMRWSWVDEDGRGECAGNPDGTLHEPVGA